MTDIGERWLRSGDYACIEGLNLRPRENQLFKGIPVIVSRGQAEAYFLSDDQKRQWILKKFHPGRNPDAGYIKAIQSVVPQVVGFEAGHQRKILNSKSLSSHGYYSSEFSAWIENTILMPLVAGCDWAFLADQIREGVAHLTAEQRLAMCKSLSSKILSLENHQTAHRDLSATNIFIDTNTWEINIIDWDSIYHSSLSMPANTTFGTNGYIAPFVNVNNIKEAKVTWRLLSDRFSLAVLNTEFLFLDKGTSVTGDGGAFDQDEIDRRCGPGIQNLVSKMLNTFPDAGKMLERAIKASDYDHCPSPGEWSVWSGISLNAQVPSLSEIYDPKNDFDQFLQRIQEQPEHNQKAPLLNEIEKPAWGNTKQAVQPSGMKAPKLSDMENPASEINTLLSNVRQNKN